MESCCCDHDVCPPVCSQQGQRGTNNRTLQSCTLLQRGWTTRTFSHSLPKFQIWKKKQRRRALGSWHSPAVAHFFLRGRGIKVWEEAAACSADLKCVLTHTSPWLLKVTHAVCVGSVTAPASGLWCRGDLNDELMMRRVAWLQTDEDGDRKWTRWRRHTAWRSE